MKVSHTLLCTLQVDMGFTSHPYLVYALTVSGMAYLFKLGPISTYVSRYVFRGDEVAKFNMNAYVPVTSAAGTPSGCLVVGRDDGSIACFQLGTLDPTAPGIIKFLMLSGSCVVCPCNHSIALSMLSFSFINLVVWTWC